MPNTLNAAMADGAAEAKPKFKIRKKHVKKVLSIGIYSLVAVMMVASMVAPIFQQY